MSARPEAAVPAPFGRRGCEVSAAEAVGTYRLLGLEDPVGPAPLPGQFYMLSAERAWGSTERGERPFLARAFSVCRVRGQRLDFLVDAIGPGTERLAELRPGERAWVVGPLGAGFSAPEAIGAPQEAAAVLVGGGIGVAPLVAWSEALAADGRPARVLLGFRSERWCGAATLFAGETSLATDDGTAPGGARVHHGLVTDLLSERLHEGPCAVFACGPPAMLEAVRRVCAEQGAPAQLALEEAMACGFGACFGCVVRTRTGYRRLCVDGPVLLASDLDEGWHG
jgi:NAD(P)H-flavin reductase